MFPFYTLEDLERGAPCVGGLTAKLAVIGSPIDHSLSPQLQQAALDAAGIPVAYIRLLAKEGEFARTVERLRELGFAGANVTVPFKKEAFALADHKDALAELSGAVNTLIFEPSGIRGANTDGPGFCLALEGFGMRPRARSIAILGACGGAGTALACACALDGCAHLTLINRTSDRLPALAATVRKAGLPAESICCVAARDSREVIRAVQGAEILVQATSLGLAAGDAPPLPFEALHSGLFVYDIVTHDTPLLAEARRRGLPSASGLSMLLYQGAEAFRLWFPEARVDVDAMKRALDGGRSS